MKKAIIPLALAFTILLSGCVQDLGPMDSSHLTGEASSSSSFSQSQVETAPSAPSHIQAEFTGKYTHEEALVAAVNAVLSGYANGTLPEPMRYNTNVVGLTNAAPRDTKLPLEVALQDIQYDFRHSKSSRNNIIVVSIPLENDYMMDIHLDTDQDDFQGKPIGPIAVYFYDLLGSYTAEMAPAAKGGEFLELKSDRLYANGNFYNVRTQAGRVSGSISFSRANGFLWIDIDSMKTPFFYTYFVTDKGELIQDYPQKEWQRTNVINDEKMLIIAQSLYEQFLVALRETEVDSAQSNVRR